MDVLNSTILVIDAQDKLLNGVQNSDKIVWNIKRLVNAAKIVKVNTICTEQNPEKLGRTNPSLLEELDFQPIKKMSFSCVKCTNILNELLKSQNQAILLCGLETHVCIQQTALDLISKGYGVFIAVDAIGSRNEFDHEIALRRLESSGVILTTTESIIFEWCGTSDREEFKAISNLIKLEFSKL